MRDLDKLTLEKLLELHNRIMTNRNQLVTKLNALSKDLLEIEAEINKRKESETVS